LSNVQGKVRWDQHFSKKPNNDKVITKEQENESAFFWLKLQPGAAFKQCIEKLKGDKAHLPPPTHINQTTTTPIPHTSNTTVEATTEIGSKFASRQ